MIKKKKFLTSLICISLLINTGCKNNNGIYIKSDYKVTNDNTIDNFFNFNINNNKYNYLISYNGKNLLSKLIDASSYKTNFNNSFEINALGKIIYNLEPITLPEDYEEYRSIINLMKIDSNITNIYCEKYITIDNDYIYKLNIKINFGNKMNEYNYTNNIKNNLINPNDYIQSNIIFEEKNNKYNIMYKKQDGIGKNCKNIIDYNNINIKPISKTKYKILNGTYKKNDIKKLIKKIDSK